ncbi:MAG: AbrB/MazE/SpoVT family DNA-binding domain-containing protein [Mariprofundaceae bacterium]|nr:AbrB/MazE/SpoVT family DNA-binding domain-containing protein [Mariprofundaceae bacterium]
MAHSSSFSEVQLGAQGRLVIPAALRKALNLSRGDHLVARKVGDSLVLERREAIESRLWDMFKAIPQEVSMVDELVAERRAVAQAENKA